MKRTAGVFLIAIFSLVIVFQSLYISKTINDPRELNNIVCGSPLPFVKFHSYRALPDHAWTRSCIGWMGNPMETPKTFLWGNFFINVAIVFGVIWGGIYFARKAYKLRK